MNRNKISFTEGYLLRIYLLLIVTFLFLSFPSKSVSDPVVETDPRILDTRKVIKEFGGQLIGRLKKAIEEDGPVNGINVCNIAAADISTNLSGKYGWQIGRTSLKTRNPNNNPDDWEYEVLQQFEQRKVNGEDIGRLEYYEEMDMNGETVFRYMKAIPTKALCLSCHGSDLAKPVKAALKRHYPEDKATGFKSGDIRGAFTITQKK